MRKMIRMQNDITIHEAVGEAEIEAFWQQLHSYHRRDIFPEPGEEDLAYFLDDSQYRAQITAIHDREWNRCYYLFFQREGQEIGFALPAVYTTEDGKCLILEFCVYPDFRGQGTGTACAKALLAWAREHGALYAELNYGCQENRFRFWNRLGFLPNGNDEWGEPLLVLPPEEELPFTVEELKDPEDWQLLKLENGFLGEIGEECLTDEKKRRLQAAVRDEKIRFFMAKRGYRCVGMCSVATAFSTFSCGQVGTFEDFYVEPVFRGKGIARLLADAARAWCVRQGIASLTVCCAPCDEAMYQALGFTLQLGTTYAALME